MYNVLFILQFDNFYDLLLPPSSFLETPPPVGGGWEGAFSGEVGRGLSQGRLGGGFLRGGWEGL